MRLRFTRTIIALSLPLLLIIVPGIMAALLLADDDAPMLAYNSANGDRALILYDLHRGLDWILAPGGSVPAWSPDGERIAYLLNGGSLVMQTLDTGRDADNIHVLLSNGTNYSRANWSPEGSRMVVSQLQNNNRLFVIELGETIHRNNLLIEGSDPIWSPDGENIVYYGWNGVINPGLFITIPTGVERGPVLVADTNSSFGFTQAQTLLFGRDNGAINSNRLYTVDLASNTETPLLALADATATAVTWSPDGRQIALVIEDAASVPNLYILNTVDMPVRDLAQLRRLTYYTDPMQAISSIHWSPDGDYIAYVAFGEAGLLGAQLDVFVAAVGDGEITQITTNPRFDVDPRWRP